MAMDEQLIRTLVEEARGDDEPLVRIALIGVILVVLVVRWWLEYRARKASPPSCRYEDPPPQPDLTPLSHAIAEVDRKLERICERLDRMEREIDDLESDHGKLSEKIDGLDKRCIELKGYLRRSTGSSR